MKAFLVNHPMLANCLKIMRMSKDGVMIVLIPVKPDSWCVQFLESTWLGKYPFSTILRTSFFCLIAHNVKCLKKMWWLVKALCVFCCTTSHEGIYLSFTNRTNLWNYLKSFTLLIMWRRLQNSSVFYHQAVIRNHFRARELRQPLPRDPP